MSKQVETLEEAARMFLAAKEDRDSAELKMEQRKLIVERMMTELGETEVTFPYEEGRDIKIKHSERSVKKFDKARVAEDMNVEEDSVKQDFIVKSVEDGKLTYGRYKGYFFRETNSNVSIRTVNAKG